MESKKRSLFATRLYTLRRNCRLTQEEVAAQLNIHRTTYTKYETDKATPDQECLIQLAELYQVSVDFLLGKDARGEPLVLHSGPPAVTLTTLEETMIATLRQLSPDEQKAVLDKATELKYLRRQREAERERERRKR